MPKTIADFVSISKPKTIADYVKVNGSDTANQNAFTNSTESTVPKVQQEQKDNGGFLGGIGYSLEKIGLGFLSGIEGIWDFAAGGLAKLFGADDWAEQQIANDWVNYNHADEWFNPSEGWQVVGDVAGGIGTSLPAMAGVAAAGIATAASGGTLAPVAATLIAGSISGLGAAGRATKEAYDQTGELTGKEFGYGALSGFTEGAIEGVSTLIGAGTGAAVKGIAKSFGKEVAKSASRQTLLKGIVKGFAGEAFEEGVQTIVEPYYKRMTYDPNAENATMQEVAYAALVGGLSGALMGGGDVAVRNIRGTSRGNTLVTEGRANDVITTAEQISAYQTENRTDYETFQVVQNTLNELKTSLEKTGGEVRTVRQKMLLGTLEQANTSAAFEPIVTASAENIYNNAETVAARLNELGYQDQNGKPLQVTAEQIREGIDITDAKSFRKTMSNALKTNSVLRTLAVADTVGQISMDTARFKDATLSGQKLSTQVDLNRFIEQATDAERQAVAERLGIDNWETLTNEQFQDKITEFVANGGVQQYQQERNLVKEAQSIAPETAKKHLPRMVNLSNDGTYRYTQGGTDIAITKRGDSYYIYDYESGLMSKALTRTETNRVLREIYTNEQNYQEGVRRHTEQQNKLREQAAELDTYARENIADYKNLSAAGQASIRATIRQGRAAGVQENFVLSCARVSAHSGLRVVFSKEASFVAANGSYADGAIDLKNNRIIINPEAKSRSGESILIHELTHAIYNDTDGTLTVAEGLETMKEAEKEKIRKRYSAIGQGSALEVSDEINAHFAEQTLSNKNILERLIEKKATLKDKILGFFKKARTDYKGDEKLTGAASRLYRQYKTLFDEFSARNQRSLGLENASAEARAQVKSIRFSLMNNRSFEENVQGILTMSDTDARANAAAGNFVSVMKNTPDVILNNVEGAQDLEVIIRFDALYLASRADGVLDGHYHDLGAEITKRLPDLISDPDAIVRMDNGRLNIFAEMKTDKGSSGIIAIELNTVKDINSKYSKYNLVVSAFSAKDNYVRNILQKRAERVEYMKKDLSQVNHQLYEWLAIVNERSNGSLTTTNSISQNTENVNPESQNGRKYALPETEQSAVDLFGHTYSWSETGYILTDGLRLDFSGRHEGGRGGYRSVDHRDISQIDAYEGKSGNEAMVDFMKRGNIRIMPEGNGINLSVRPTKAQENTLADFISRKRGEVTLDIDNESGDTIVSVEYPRGTHSNKVLQDIRNYFENGATPTVSEVQRFRYALPETDSDGRTLTAQQRRYFNDTKVVDENGRLLSVYHGTKNGNFTVFQYDKARQTGDDFGKAYYFTTNLKNAKGYAKDNHKDPRVKQYQERRNELSKQIVAAAERGESVETIRKLEGEFRNVRVDGKSLLEILYDTDYDTGGAILNVYLNLRNPLIVDAGGEVYYRVYPQYFEQARSGNNDGIIIKNVDDSSVYGVGVSDVYIAFDENQIKLTSNKTPTSNNDIRYALDSSEDGNSRSRSNYSAGQRARFVANNTGMRVYNRAEAEDVINSIIEDRLVFEDIGMQGELRGKDRQEIIDYLFKELNSAKEGYRGGVALRIADYMIERTVLTDMYSNSTGEVSDAMHRLSVLRGYMHKIDLRGIQDEIRYRFDKKNSINLVWGAKEGGIAPDTLPQLLADEGIFIDETNAADSFLRMVDMYEEARTTVNNATEKVMLTTYGDATTIKNLRQQIARDVLNAYEQKGRKSKYAKLVEKYTKQIADLKQRLSESNANNRLINSIVDQAQKMRDLKLGTFLNSSQYKSEVFKNSIEALGKIKFRGNFNISGTRKIMADLRTWYTKENPLLTDSYEQGIADMLDEVANGTKSYSRSELQTINRLMAYFTNFVEKFNKVYRQGKWVDAIPEATRYIETIHNNEQVKVGLFRKIAGSTYMQTFGDPMTVARRMDMYERGFYTEMLTELREAAIDADVTEMEIRQNYDDFMNRNKKYLSQSAKQTVEYRGVDVPKMHLISLYMTLKRTHAQAGLAQNGFAFTDADGKRVRVDGFAPEITDASELRAAAIEEQAAIAKLLTETDKEYIAILEKAFNEDAKKLKADRDMQRLGFTNATEDYYYPIRRGNIAKNVDTSDIQGELDRVSSASFNKDTVRGAKQELYIESADTVFNRHIHAVAQYAALSPAIETYNKLYNLDIGGNANKPISVATESANIWPKGNQYFSKLISDIQGIQSTPTEGMQLLGRVRGNYAKFQLGANPKVWVTQLSSLFAASNMLDASSISRGMFISANDVDTYCPLAKLRAQDNTAAMAQGVLDKVGKFSDILMAPIGKMDRFVVRRLFGACQVQVQKDGGAAIGTEANKIEAGKLLKNVILETQQNSLATERSAAMRSGNEILRTLTMFSADSMKAIGRVIDSIGELSTLRAKLRMTTDTARQSELKAQIKTARKKVFKSMTALTTSAMFMVGVAQLFKWLYNKDQDDEEPAAQQILVDFVGNLLGGLPLWRDLYSRIAEGYSVDNYAYSALNDLLDSVVNIFDTVGSFITGEESSSKLSARVKNLINSLGQLTGIPTRNLYNVFYGLTKRISPTTAYKIDEFFYTKNYVSDLNKAIENDDTDMMAMLMSMIFGERMGNTNMNDSVRDKFIDLYLKGYSVLPRSIGDTISYGGVDIPLSEEEYSRFHSIYAQAMKDLNKMVSSSSFTALSEELQAKAIKQVYDAYYYDALTDLVGVDERTTVGELAAAIDMSKLSVAVAGLSNITSDKNASGQTVSGSKKKNTIKYLLGQDLSDGERLLILCYRGYSIQDGDYKGYTATRAKQILLRYILKLNISQAEKAAIAQKCGFSVRNNRIIRDF